MFKTLNAIEVVVVMEEEETKEKRGTRRYHRRVSRRPERSLVALHKQVMIRLQLGPGTNDALEAPDEK